MNCKEKLEAQAKEIFREIEQNDFYEGQDKVGLFIDWKQWNFLKAQYLSVIKEESNDK